MAIGFVQLPAFRAPTGIDFTPLNEAFDTIGEARRRNRLLEEAKELGASLQPAQGQAPTSYTAQPVNRLMPPAQGSFAAAGRDYSPAASSSPYSNAISSIESGGRYDLVGPVTRTGDRAYGKYQVMGENVGPWTREILGREMTPQQFLADQDAQEKVFAGKFGQYVQKTGNPSDAASMWFTGRPQAEGANRRDILGTTGSEYVRRFNAALPGGGQPAATPAAAPAPSGGLNYAAGIQTALRQGNLSLAMQLQNAQQEVENQTYTRGRQATQDAQAAESHALTTQGQRDELQKNFVTRVAALAQNIASDPDPASRTAKWNRLVSADPRFAASLRQAGIDPSDVNAGTAALIAEARGLTGKKYEFTKYGVGDPSTGEIKPYPQGAGDASDQLERAKYEQQLRKEWSALTTETKTVNDSVARVRKGAELDSGSGDLAVVYGYMKLLDPGSVVREGEFATAEQTAGLPQQVVAIYNRIINGERLTPSQRQQFLTAAEGLATDKSQRFEATRRQFEGIARQAGSDPARIMLDEGASSAPPPANAGASAPKEAIDMLRQDPSPEAQREFDEIFGAGAAKRALGR